jgi:post-segregation antitoxin (ccd killing protein)
MAVAAQPKRQAKRHLLALPSGDMPSDTATIRVPRQTRDRLAARARDRGVSLSALLTELAENAERDDAYRSEREATRADMESPEALAEYRLWEATLEDGID